MLRLLELVPVFNVGSEVREIRTPTMQTAVL